MFLRCSLIALATLTTTAALARPGVSPRTYTASYDAKRDVYCIRFFSDALAADPHPGRPALVCQTRARWAAEGVGIQHAGRIETAAAR